MGRKLFEYCERGFDPGFWAEPLNAITNAAFIIAAAMATMMWLRIPAAERRWVDAWLLLVLYAIGIGSFLLHLTQPALGYGALSIISVECYSRR